MKAMRNAIGKGFTDVLYLDSAKNKYIEEASSSNIFIIKVHIYVQFYIFSYNYVLGRVISVRFQYDSDNFKLVVDIELSPRFITLCGNRVGPILFLVS